MFTSSGANRTVHPARAKPTCRRALIAMVLACGWAAAVDAAARLARSPGNQTTKEISMQLYQQYSVNFYSDGSDTLTFKLTDPPLNLDITGSEASALEDAQFRPVSNVVASPFLKECTL